MDADLVGQCFAELEMTFFPIHSQAADTNKSLATIR